MRRRRAAAAALVALAGAALVVGVALGGAWLAGRAAPPPGVVTQVDQLGDRIAIVQVQGAGASAAADAARASTVRWMFAALGVALVPLLGLGWLLAGRLAPAAGGAGRPRRRRPCRAAAAPDGEAERLRTERDRDRRHLQEVVHELRTPLAVAATNLDLAVTTPGWTPTSAATWPRPAGASSGWLGRSTTWPRTGGSPSATTAPSTSPSRSARWPTSTAASPRPEGSRSTSKGPTRLVVAADRAAVHTAVGNLLANAVRLAPSGSIVWLATGTWDDWAWIAVRDEGPGLPDVDHERAFRRYWRGRYDLDRDTGDGGARGLGLTICRQVTEAQGGHVTVRSAVGVGSTFVVWLPRSADARTDAVVAADGVHHRVDPLPGRPAAIAPSTDRSRSGQPMHSEALPCRRRRRRAWRPWARRTCALDVGFTSRSVPSPP